MSADSWDDCPCCGNEECVKVYYIRDYDLNQDGTITNNIRAQCTKCKTEWGKK